MGIFVTEDELVANGMDSQLEGFFEYLRELEATIPISADYIAEMERLSVLNKDIYVEAEKARTHSKWQGPSFVARQAAFDRRKESFRKEWLSTLGILQDIQLQLLSYRPAWVAEDVPLAWQVDQFLHAYYYNKVGEGLSKPYEDYHQRNCASPQSALRVELEWWQRLQAAPSHEDQTLYRSAPRIRELLAQDKILALAVGDFESLCSNTHATMDHVVKVPLSVLGRSDLKTMSMNERVKLFAPLIMAERNGKGWDIRKLLHYVLYEGADADIWQRLYNAGRDPNYTISRYGLNSIAEVVGWARPETVPPRNGRTSKALRALGFGVKIY